MDTANVESMEYIKSRLGDVWWRLNNLYKIEDENGNLVTFKMRPAQRELFEQMHQKNIILKARQLGFSTAIDIYLLDQAIWNKNLKCGIIAQDRNASGEIYRTKVEIPFDNLPSYVKALVNVETRKAGTTGGFMLFGNGSSIQVSTSFRSGTVQRLHISEHGKICAKYPQKAKEVKTGTLNAVHKDSIVFIESTAEGVGGDFYTMSIKALENKKANALLTKMDWKFHFFAWWQDPKYHTPVKGKRLAIGKAMREYFQGIEEAMDTTLSDEQKQWYLDKYDEQGEEMKQEFPSTPLEAFLTSGRRVFNAVHIMRAEGQCQNPLIAYDIEPITGKKTRANRPERMDDQGQRSMHNHLLVWELPDEEEEYAIGVDIAEGLEHGDRSSIDVVRKDTGEQVAHWFGYIDVELLAYICKHIAVMYNHAYVGPERNNHGHAFILKLKDIYPTRHIYSEQYIDREDEDETVKLGWLTTKHSKPILTESLKPLLKDGVSGIRWIGTISELNTYVYDKKGSMNAQEECFDDQVMSYLIAQEMRARMPTRMKQDNTPRTRKHWMTK
ncbi:terminase [Vibrio breoganii]|uniref:Terminase n=1 Tax=Vibrio breoganii TaxID=553239 RepID=A0AAP8SWH8_9VIBR|nr:terminase [Vibrio breoganii]PMP10223.1 terminase [Vibrio breoganii]